MESTVLGVVPSALNFFVKSFQLGYEVAGVPSETSQIFQTIDSVNEDIRIAKQKRIDLAKAASSEELVDLDRAISCVEEALQSVEKLVEPTRIDKQLNNGQIRAWTRLMWVVKESKNVVATSSRLTLANQRFQTQLLLSELSPRVRQEGGRHTERETQQIYETAPPAYTAPAHQEATKRAMSERRKDRPKIARPPPMRHQIRNLPTHVLGAPEHTVSDYGVVPGTSQASIPGLTGQWPEWRHPASSNDSNAQAPNTAGLFTTHSTSLQPPPGPAPHSTRSMPDLTNACYPSMLQGSPSSQTDMQSPYNTGLPPSKTRLETPDSYIPYHSFTSNDTTRPPHTYMPFSQSYGLGAPPISAVPTPIVSELEGSTPVSVQVTNNERRSSAPSGGRYGSIDPFGPIDTPAMIPNFHDSHHASSPPPAYSPPPSQSLNQQHFSTLDKATSPYTAPTIPAAVPPRPFSPLAQAALRPVERRPYALSGLDLVEPLVSPSPMQDSSSAGPSNAIVLSSQYASAAAPPPPPPTLSDLSHPQRVPTPGVPGAYPDMTSYSASSRPAARTSSSITNTQRSFAGHKKPIQVRWQPTPDKIATKSSSSNISTAPSSFTSHTQFPTTIPSIIHSPPPVSTPPPSAYKPLSTPHPSLQEQVSPSDSETTDSLSPLSTVSSATTVSSTDSGLSPGLPRTRSVRPLRVHGAGRPKAQMGPPAPVGSVPVPVPVPIPAAVSAPATIATTTVAPAVGVSMPTIAVAGARGNRNSVVQKRSRHDWQVDQLEARMGSLLI